MNEAPSFGNFIKLIKAQYMDMGLAAAQISCPRVPRDTQDRESSSECGAPRGQGGVPARVTFLKFFPTVTLPSRRRAGRGNDSSDPRLSSPRGPDGPQARPEKHRARWALRILTRTIRRPPDAGAVLSGSARCRREGQEGQRPPSHS